MEIFDGYPVRKGFRGLDWELEDCAATAREHPDTFEVPAPSEEVLAQVGALLRLHFVLTDKAVLAQPNTPRAERMWVEVCVPSQNGVLWGHLTNEPVCIESLEAGDVIEFKWVHVAQVYVTKDDPRHRGARA
jgi:hypothetical protein